MCQCVRFFCFFKQKTAYEMRISDWSSDVCSSDLAGDHSEAAAGVAGARRLDSSVERQQVGLPGDLVDAPRHVTNQVEVGLAVGDDRLGVLDRSAGCAHG